MYVFVHLIWVIGTTVVVYESCEHTFTTVIANAINMTQIGATDFPIMIVKSQRIATME